MKTLVLATRNPGKVREFQTLLGPLGYEVITAAQAGYHEEPEETGATFHENAEIKARTVFEGLDGKYSVLSDDSGLAVDALQGAPGVWSARYAGSGCTDQDNNLKLLSEMVGKEDRAARYQIALCLVESCNESIFFEDEELPWCGMMLTEEGIRQIPERVEALGKLKEPENYEGGEVDRNDWMAPRVHSSAFGTFETDI